MSAISRLLADLHQCTDGLFSAIGLSGQIAMVDRRSRTVIVRIGPWKTEGGEAFGLRDAARVVTEALR